MSAGRFGEFGGQYVPETLMNAVHELEEAYEHYKNDPEFIKELDQLEREYAGFVNKLRLYLSAGLTVRNAFMRITKEYEKNRRNGKKHYLYEELKISCSQLENGMAEEQVYFDFGQRCGEMRFRRLSSLLGVQLTKGNDQLLKNLAKEADNAIEDQRNQARKVGEEAGTKLLFPMMLMLLLVMFFILLPAYLDFGSIENTKWN